MIALIGGGSVMVSSIQGSMELYFIKNGSLTGIRYRGEILHPIVRPFAGVKGTEFVLMDDNTRPQISNIVNQYLEADTIERMNGLRSHQTLILLSMSGMFYKGRFSN